MIARQSELEKVEELFTIEDKKDESVADLKAGKSFVTYKKKMGSLLGRDKKEHLQTNIHTDRTVTTQHTF